MPKITIIIPTYNSSATLGAALNSILEQSFVDFEILIMDGCSTDNTLEIAQSFSDERVKIYSEPDKGVYDAMNKGIEKSNGEWLYFLGSDDTLYDRDVLLTVSSNFENNNFVYGNCFLINSRDYYSGSFDLNRLLYSNICHQGIFYRRDLIKSVGSYNLRYKIWADYEFNLRCFTNLQLKPYFLDKTIANYNDGKGLSKIEDEDFKEVIEFIRRIVLQSREEYKTKIIKKMGLVGFFIKYIKKL